MSEVAISQLAQDALMTSFLVSAPILGVTLVIGVVISLIQAVTQVNEATLTFVPKILGVFAVSALLGPWMVGTMVSYTERVFATLPQVVQ